MFKQYWNRIEKLWSFRSTSAYLAHLRKTGMRIGEGTEVFARTTDILIDTTRPWLIEIGRNVQLTAGVKILTHGYDWAVLKAKYGDIYGSAGKVTIGDDCFIGMNALILKGTTIGDRVIVGAGSVVAGGTFPSDCVIAGNPARVICTLEAYRAKRAAAQLAEAKQLVTEYQGFSLVPFLLVCNFSPGRDENSIVHLFAQHFPTFQIKAENPGTGVPGKQK